MLTPTRTATTGGLVHVADDELVHVATRSGARKADVLLTECGRHPTGDAPSPVRKGTGCHLCLPAFAHPLAEVWATCRRWDAVANARS